MTTQYAKNGIKKLENTGLKFDDIGTKGNGGFVATAKLTLDDGTVLHIEQCENSYSAYHDACDTREMFTIYGGGFETKKHINCADDLINWIASARANRKAMVEMGLV